jgi:hypothetical protein
MLVCRKLRRMHGNVASVTANARPLASIAMYLPQGSASGSLAMSSPVVGSSAVQSNLRLSSYLREVCVKASFIS